jgi:four helix bundle protein
LSAFREKAEFRRRVYRYVVKLVRFMMRIPTGSGQEIIKHQLIRSGSSIGANFFESYGASSKKDFMNYSRHALKSANETRFWLALLNDSGLIPHALKSEFEELRSETKELANIYASSILTMKRKK